MIDSNKGTLLAIGPREGFEDAVLGIDFLKADEHGEATANTNWPIKLSFPLFVSNLLQYFGRNQQAVAGTGYRPGQPAALRSESPGALAVKTPSGQIDRRAPDHKPRSSFSQTDQLGVYDVREAGRQFNSSPSIFSMPRKATSVPGPRVRSRSGSSKSSRQVTPCRSDVRHGSFCCSWL